MADSRRQGTGSGSVVELPSGGQTEIALLDRRGVIVAVNQAWRDFCANNAGDINRTGVGMSYTAVCDAAGDDANAVLVRELIDEALRGQVAAATRVRLPCHSPRIQRWFDLLISSRFADSGSCCGATVTLSPAEPNHLSVLPPSQQLPGHAERRHRGSPRGVTISVSLMLDALADGLVVVDGGGHILQVNRKLEAQSGYDAVSLVGQQLEILVHPASQSTHPGNREPLPASRLAGSGTHRPPAGLHRSDLSTQPLEIWAEVADTDAQPGALIAAQDLEADRGRREQPQPVDLRPPSPPRPPGRVTATGDREQAGSSSERVDDLTPRERRVLGLIAQGLTNRQIGDQLGLAEKTVKNYVGGILSKLGMPSRVHAAVYAATALDRTAVDETAPTEGRTRNSSDDATAGTDVDHLP